MITRKLLSILAAALVLSGCGSSPTSPTQVPPPDTGPVDPGPPPPAPVVGVTHILAFGDSMTQGVVSAAPALRALTAGIPQSYPFKLQALMTARYTDQTITVLNAGLAGQRATEDRTRFNSALSEAKPELLLLLEGANDLANGIGVTTTVDAMEDMVRDATGRGVRVMLATLPPSRTGGPRALAPDTLRRYNDALKVMAAKKGAQLVDVNTLLPASLIGQDGLHPTEEGYQRLAEIFLDAIKGSYETTPAPAVR